MRLYPAIDILGENAVRLVKGDFEAKKVYDEDPLAAARGWTRAGARRLHVVDLDGAKRGEPVNLEHLRRIAGELGVPVQYGGGLRSAEAIAAALGAGAERVILGTAAFTDERLVREALAAHGPERVLASIDVRSGRVATHGWLQSTDMRASDAFAALRERGLRNFVFTDIDRDGMLDGASLGEVLAAASAAMEGSMIYSGGIGSLADLRALAALRSEHELDALAGVIVGKALYERRFTVAEAHAALQ
ncbi:MAG: phosphoribosyl isomerase [Solirubrobacteraceae bacterium]|nr:phosphoribosyl isomerase [Solirubrobacteraceae bacterium]